MRVVNGVLLRHNLYKPSGQHSATETTIACRLRSEQRLVAAAFAVFVSAVGGAFFDSVCIQRVSLLPVLLSEQGGALLTLVTLLTPLC